MNKILVKVKVPMIEKSYDIRIPVSKNIKITSKLLVDTINELSEGHFPKKEVVQLMLTDGTILQNTDIVKKCGLKNGETIVII